LTNSWTRCSSVSRRMLRRASMTVPHSDPVILPVLSTRTTTVGGPRVSDLVATRTHMLPTTFGSSSVTTFSDSVCRQRCTSSSSATSVHTLNTLNRTRLHEGLAAPESDSVDLNSRSTQPRRDSGAGRATHQPITVSKSGLVN